MFNFTETPLAGVTLGIPTPDLMALHERYPLQKSYCWTISLPDYANIPTSIIRPRILNRKKTIRWKDLTPIQQWNYVKLTYVGTIAESIGLKQFTGFPELNKNGNIHVHIILFSENPDYDVVTLRKLLLQHNMSNQFHQHHSQRAMRQNYIHTRNNESEYGQLSWPEYITKHYSFNA